MAYFEPAAPSTASPDPQPSLPLESLSGFSEPQDLGTAHLTHDEWWHSLSLLEKIKEFYYAETGALRSLQLLHGNEHMRSFLIVLYATIDSCAYLNSTSENPKVGQTYVFWLDKYFDCIGLGAKSEELYSARCGILHTMAPRSRKQTAREIHYCWGPVQPSTLLPTDSVTMISLDNLARTFELALEKWLLHLEQEIDKNPRHAEIVAKKLVGRFSSIPPVRKRADS